MLGRLVESRLQCFTCRASFCQKLYLHFYLSRSLSDRGGTNADLATSSLQLPLSSVSLKASLSMCNIVLPPPTSKSCGVTNAEAAKNGHMLWLVSVSQCSVSHCRVAHAARQSVTIKAGVCCAHLCNCNILACIEETCRVKASMFHLQSIILSKTLPSLLPIP
jgi:hypothetical protein